MITIKGTFTFNEEIMPDKNCRGYAKTLEDTPIGIMFAQGYGNYEMSNWLGTKPETVGKWRDGVFNPNKKVQRRAREFLISIGLLPTVAAQRAVWPPRPKANVDQYESPTSGQTYSVFIPNGEWNTFEATMRAYRWEAKRTAVVKSKCT